MNHGRHFRIEVHNLEGRPEYQYLTNSDVFGNDQRRTEWYGHLDISVVCFVCTILFYWIFIATSCNGAFAFHASNNRRTDRTSMDYSLLRTSRQFPLDV